MRTQDEIKARMTEVEDRDFFGFERGDLVEFLEFENAKPFLKEGVTAEDWTAKTDPKSEILGYLDFAWDKANNCRGLSASRSMFHMSAWLWLMGEDELSESVHEYDFYGKPHLVTISDLVGFDWRAVDSNRWQRDESDAGISAEQALAA